MTILSMEFTEHLVDHVEQHRLHVGRNYTAGTVYRILVVEMELNGLNNVLGVHDIIQRSLHKTKGERKLQLMTPLHILMPRFEHVCREGLHS